MRQFRPQYFLAAAVAVTQGCATINSGPYGVPVDASSRPLPTAGAPPLRVSATEIASLANSYFGLVEATFENDSPAWLQIDHIELDFGSAVRNQSVQIPWGDDLATWYEATSYRNAVVATNQQTALSTLAIVGTLGRAAGGRRGRGAPVSGVSGALAIGALGTLYANDFKQTASRKRPRPSA